MINKRTYRPSGSVERLQQLSLNSSDGISCIRPHNDTKSVYDAKNLIVNQDGSLSLRKPLILKNTFASNIERVIPVGNALYIAIGTFSNAGSNVEGFILLDENLNSISFRLEWYDMYNNQRIHTVPVGTCVQKKYLDISACTYAETNTGALLGNCKLASYVKNEFPGTALETYTYYDIVNRALYDTTESITDNGNTVNYTWLPRVVQLFYDETRTWHVRIHCPVPNNYAFENNELVQHTNTLLDNPYAMRDTYGTAVPSIKAIRAYVSNSNDVSNAYRVATASKYVSVSSTANMLCDTTVYNAAHSRPTLRVYGELPISVTVGDVGIVCSATVTLSFNFAIVKRTMPEELYIADLGVVNNPVRNSTISFSVTRQQGAQNSVLDNLDCYAKINQTTCTMTLQFKGRQNELIGTVTVPISYSSDNNGWNFTLTNDSFYTRLVQALNDLSQTALKALFDLSLNQQADTPDTNVGVSFSVVPLVTFVYREPFNTILPTTVAQLTESSKNSKFAAVTSVDYSKVDKFVLKAFMNIPSVNFGELYCSWRGSIDGITWTDMLASTVGKNNTAGYTYVVVSDTNTAPLKDLDTGETPTAQSFRYIKLSANTFMDNIIETQNLSATALCRPDCLEVTVSNSAFTVFRFTICTLDNFGTRNVTIDSTPVTEATATVKATYGTQDFYAISNASMEPEHVDFGNVSEGKLLYSKSRAFFYGNDALKNLIFYTYAGELNTPITNSVELASGADSNVTTLVRWRDYLVGATKSSLYLITPSGDDNFVKILNPSVGIPEEDSRCCVPVLNGILFKTQNKVYHLYPNMYSDDGTVLNITDISLPVRPYLDNYISDTYTPFAFTTEDEYVLMLPGPIGTECLKYNYTTRVWTHAYYNAVFEDVRVNALDDIRIFGHTDSSVKEFILNATFEQFPFDEGDKTRLPTLRYGDVLKHMTAGALGAYGSTKYQTVADLTTYFGSTVHDVIEPIEFELDTGQKSDTILTTKQFVESKLVFATLTKQDAFPMQLIVHIDGDPHIVTTDISTDAPFWKEFSTSAVLNTAFFGLSSTSKNFNTLRQLIVRYSGKGKSIRHILTGESLYNFKLYETYIRYKLLNVKQ